MAFVRFRRGCSSVIFTIATLRNIRFLEGFLNRGGYYFCMSDAVARYREAESFFPREQVVVEKKNPVVFFALFLAIYFSFYAIFLYLASTTVDSGFKGFADMMSALFGVGLVGIGAYGLLTAWELIKKMLVQAYARLGG
jgi:hypothetical protein